MKVVFLGGLYRKSIQEEINNKSKKMPYFAANNHQWAIIDGLEIVNAEKNLILNAMHVKSFPIYNDIYIKSAEWSHNNVMLNKDIGFLNIFGIKHIWRAIILTIELMKIIKQSEEDLTILTYGLHNPFLFAAYLNQKLFHNHRNIKWCCIIPEIPKFYIGIQGKSKLYNILKKLDWNFSHLLLKRADSYQLLTKSMAELLGVNDSNYIVIEGVMDTSLAQKNDFEKIHVSNNQKTVLYTGTTNVEFGILDLLEAFSKIEDYNYRLVICGTGSGDEEIKKKMKEDKRIEWKGFVSREEVIKLQERATVLINPRRPDQEFTKYSFPSKTMEYLFSGTPVIMHKLEGIPNEYDQFLNYFKSTDIKDIKNLITDVCNWNSIKRDNYKKMVIDFIESEKSVKSQGEKLFRFLKSRFQ